MKIYKWKKTDLDPVKLLRHVNAVVGNQGYPSFVFVSPKKLNEIKKEVYRLVKKECPSSTKQQIAYNAALHLLNFAPNVLKGLPDNLILVDNVAIAEKN